MTYGLGWKPRSNIKTDRGSIVHKALELVARAKLAAQNGHVDFEDPELSVGKIPVDVSDEDALEHAWKHYTVGPAKTAHNWSHYDHQECNRLFQIALTHSNGAFNPRNRTVIQPEQYFDITLPYDWARYEYTLPSGQVITGQLALKGTVDLVLEGYRHSDVEYCDWKSGAMMDWAEFREKTIEDLYEDFQLRLYHLALTELYPEAKNILITIFFLKHGPYSLAYERDEIPQTLERIRKWFETVRDTEIPQRRITKACDSFCKFGTTSWKDQEFVPKGTDPHADHKSICDHAWDEVQELGVERVLAKHGNGLSHLGRYGAGGGSQDRDGPK